MPALSRDTNQRTIDSLTRELLTSYEELTLLYSVIGQLGRLTTEDQIAAAAIKEAVEVVRAEHGWFVAWTGGEPRIPAVSRIGVSAETAACVSQEFLRPIAGASDRNLLLHDLSYRCGHKGTDHPVRLLACPVQSGGYRAWLCLGRSSATAVFTSADKKLLTAVASLVTIVFDNLRLQRAGLEAERLEHELDIASSIQQALLPREFRCFSWLDADGESTPCYQIGGDYFDVIPLEADACLFVIADVSGKGPAAALRAATVQGNVHAVSRNPFDLPGALHVINDAFRSRASDAAGYVTACLAVLDSAGLFRYANGGHNPPLWISKSGSVTELSEGGPLVGVLPQPTFTEAAVTLATGDLILLYTDGVIDIEDEHGEPFGIARLTQWAASQAGNTPGAARQVLNAELSRFCCGQAHPDDLTFLFIQYLVNRPDDLVN